MHETTLADAFRPATSVVLGLELADYAIGHDLALWLRRNPLLNGTEAVGRLLPSEKLVALAQAVQVCARKEIPKDWAKTSGVDVDVEEETVKFLNHMALGTLDLPTIKQPRANGVPFHYFGAPEMARLLNYVTAHHGLLIQKHYEGSPLMFPVGLARILFTTHCETEGNLWVKNWNDYHNEARRREYERQHPEGGIAEGHEAVRRAARQWNSEHPEHPVPEE